VRRSDGLLPFQSWDEVERVADEAGRWAPFVILAADTGARPGELTRLEHRHVIGAKVYLPGTKTRNARRIVTLTPRGLAAYAAIPRDLVTPLVFHTNGAPLDLHNFRSRVWYPALELARLESRGPYQLRHTFAFFSLLAGVPISDLSVEMGHDSIRLTHEAYGHWSDDLGTRAADLRATWAATHNPTPHSPTLTLA
jgi:integrase